MVLPILASDRFTPEHGLRITVQVPDQYTQKIVDVVLKVVSLKYGDYDSVTFKTALGVQQFKSLGSGRNAATEAVLQVPCVELSFFTVNAGPLVAQVLEAIYSAHPYEEPVIFVEECLRTQHIRGMDEDSPHKFWNSAPADWVPKEHR